jgi:hypothetical protein
MVRCLWVCAFVCVYVCVCVEQVCLQTYLLPPPRFAWTAGVWRQNEAVEQGVKKQATWCTPNGRAWAGQWMMREEESNKDGEGCTTKRSRRNAWWPGVVGGHSCAKSAEGNTHKKGQRD